MSLEDSPVIGEKLEWDSDASFHEEKPPKGKRTARIVILLLFVMGALLGGINILQSDLASGIAGKGAITGSAVDEMGQAVAVEVFVIGYELESQSDAQGNFRLDGIPAGAQVVVVGYQGVGHEFPVTILPGENVDIGQVRVVETEFPQE